MQNFSLIIVLITCLWTVSCRKNMPPARSSYVLNDSKLVPEGIDYSAKHNAFYLTSVAKSKIIKVDASTGSQSDFINEKEYEYMPGVGLLVDDQRNELHALGGYYMGEDSRTSLYTFDLTSGELLRKLNVQDEGEHFLNDMILDKQGGMYLTDTKYGAVYFLPLTGDSLELLYRSEEIEFPNGIAINDGNTLLYVASMPKGIRIIDLEYRELINEQDTSGMTTGIDGLEYHKGNLYAIQNGLPIELHNFRKLVLSEDERSIAGVEVIVENTPDLNVPLTFCITPDEKAVVIGNSNLQYLDQINFTFEEPDSLQRTKLLIYNINE